MEIAVLSGADVRRLLPMRSCIDVMTSALGDLAEGNAHMPPRMVSEAPRDLGILVLMPGDVDGADGTAFGFKAVTAFAGNPARGLETVQGVIVILDPETGRVSAVIDAATVTEIRTSAVSAAATDRLARADATTLGILGSGAQARGHLDAIACVRDVSRARVWSRSPEHGRRFVEEQASRFAFPIELAATAQAAVADADIVVTATASEDPVLELGWLAPGAHVNSVGYAPPLGRELTTELVSRAALFVDSRVSATSECGDIRIPIRDGAITEDHIQAELGEVLVGRHPGRVDAKQLTVFKSYGLAVEDVACGRFLAAAARDSGKGGRAEL